MYYKGLANKNYYAYKCKLKSSKFYCCHVLGLDDFCIDGSNDYELFIFRTLYKAL